jgi:hypothetical protein
MLKLRNANTCKYFLFCCPFKSCDATTLRHLVPHLARKGVKLFLRRATEVVEPDFFAHFSSAWPAHQIWPLPGGPSQNKHDQMLDNSFSGCPLAGPTFSFDFAVKFTKCCQLCATVCRVERSQHTCLKSTQSHAAWRRVESRNKIFLRIRIHIRNGVSPWIRRPRGNVCGKNWGSKISWSEEET